ncbi:MAG: hypothetical protein K6T66_14545 [Peptococcaceae bacterium]|nr:hypothetical protein [Peptococcaceae bacterium]
MMILEDRRGSASVLALFMIVCFFAAGALVTDAARHFCIKVAVKHKLNLACRSAAAQLDGEELKNASLVIDEARAAQAFYDVLKTNLLLDDGLMPLPGSILNSGPVRVVYFKVVNPGEAPFTYSYGGYVETVDRAAVTAVISFPVKSGAFARLAGGPEETVMYCHVTAAPELISRPVDKI